MNTNRIYLSAGTCAGVFVSWLILEQCCFGFSWLGLEFNVFCFWLFPSGYIEAIFGWDAANSYWAPLTGWIVHSLLMICILCVNNRALFRLFYGILYLLLALDLVGSHEDMLEFSKS